MSDKTKTPEANAEPTLAALIRAASNYAYEIAAAIKDENAENAKALKLVLDDDPAAEFHVAVMLAPAQCAVVSVVTGGKQYIISSQDVIVPVTRH